MSNHRQKLRRAISLAIVVLLLAAAAYSLRPQPFLVETGNPVVQTVREYIAEDAKTRLADEYLVDMPLNGTLDRIEFEVGDFVEAGQVVARMNTFDIEQQIRGVEALVAQAQAQMRGVDVMKPKPESLEAAELGAREAQDALAIAQKQRAIVEINAAQAQKEFERAQEMLEGGVISPQQFDEAQLQFQGLQQDIQRAVAAEEAARKGVQVARLQSQELAGSVDDNEYLRQTQLAEVERLQSQIDILRDNLAKAEIRAPVTGPILEKFVIDERVLPAGTPIMRLGDLGSIEIECDVLSEEVGRVQERHRALLLGKALATSENSSAVVKRVYPSAFTKISALGIEQQRVKVLLDFDNSAFNLRPGTSLDVRIITAEQPDAVAVPERAVFRREGAWHVFKVDGSVARLARVELGLKNDEWAEIKSGLTVDDLIITQPMNDLTDGARVEPKQAPDWQ